MSETKIEWTDRTWNPVTGCHKVSPGCKHCYAEGVAKRFWRTQYQPVDGRSREFGDVQVHTDRLPEPFSWKKPCKVFVNSMSDLFEEAVPFEFIAAVFAVMAHCDRHTFQVLTKRPQRMREFMEWVNAPEGFERITELYGDHAGEAITMARMHRVDEDITMQVWGFDDSGVDLNACLHNNGVWPPENVWLGVSVENQKYADERIPLLLQTPAAVRFISYEPALGPVDLVDHGQGTSWLTCHQKCGPNSESTCLTHEATDGRECFKGIDWVILGGESGPGARPFDIAWARAIVQQCAAASVACFVKQMGHGTGMHTEIGRGGHVRDGAGGYILIKDKKGGDMAEWPEDLRVRQFPEERQ